MSNKLIILSLLGLLNSASAGVVTGEVFKKDSNRKELLYNFKNNITDMSGVTKADAQFVEPGGAVVVVETSEREGTKLKRYEIDHKQTGRKGSIVVDGNKVKFNFEENGKKKNEEIEDLKDNFIVGHTLVPYVTNHWKELMEGKTIDIRYGVWDRQETVGFSLFKVGQEKNDDKEAILLKFKPTSFIIAAIVDPVIFKFSTDGKELLGMVGRVAPKRKDGNRWKDLDADVVYKNQL